MTTTDDYVTKAESARKVRKTLHAAFNAKFSVTSKHADIDITWEDSGPTLDQVNDALKTAGLAEVVERYGGGEYLTVDHHHLYYDRFNAAEREAFRRDLERRLQEREEEKQREVEALKQARAARAMPAMSRERPTASDPDPAVFAAFEQLRQRAEAEITHDSERRPTWAPPLILGEALGEACYELGYITDDDKWIGRLWASFATPKRSGRIVREKISRHALHGIACRGLAVSQTPSAFAARGGRFRSYLKPTKKGPRP
jgi:hypothetical protein